MMMTWGLMWTRLAVVVVVVAVAVSDPGCAHLPWTCVWGKA